MACDYVECPASGRSCDYTPNGPNGENQCRYCGSREPARNALAVVEGAIMDEHNPHRNRPHNDAPRSARPGRTKFKRY